MGLSCDCDFDPDECDSYYYYPSEFSKLKTTKRKRCISCENLIDIGSIVVAFDMLRHPHGEIEERCKGDEIPMASKYICEKCGEIWFNLIELGYCLNVFDQSMQEYLKEYHEISGFKKEE